ncbi:MAG: DUF3164 family protein [Chthoniobacterales bacterium]
MQNLENYKADSQGRLVPLASIKPIDLERDDLISKLVQEAKAARDVLRKLRDLANADIQAFAEISAEKYGLKKLGGIKGNLTLMSFDGRYKVQRAIADVLVFDERLQAAKQLIDECLTLWSQDSGKEIRTIVASAFQVDKQGNISTGRVLSLRRHNFDHPKWVAAMEAISDSLNVATSRSYIRFYERDEKSGEYLPINLDLANA